MNHRGSEHLLPRNHNELKKGLYWFSNLATMLSLLIKLIYQDTVEMRSRYDEITLVKMTFDIGISRIYDQWK